VSTPALNPSRNERATVAERLKVAAMSMSSTEQTPVASPPLQKRR
jgi:hypothetical protein